MDIAIDLLRRLTTIKFGPDAITWQALVTSFAAATEQFQIGEEWEVMSAITSAATELGNLFDPRDRQMTTNLITLYDGRKLFEKVTKMNGSDVIQNAFFNLIACTTPGWIEENIPESMIGGGLSSRFVYIYAEKKDKLVDWPADAVPAGMKEQSDLLVADLERISLLSGPFTVSREAREWNKKWYTQHNTQISSLDERAVAALSRKQTKLFKLAMILSASQRDDLVITLGDVTTSYDMLTDLEAEMPKVFARIGKTPESRVTDRFLEFVRRRQIVPYEEAHRFLHAFLSDPNQIVGVIVSGVRSGYIDYKQEAGKVVAVMWKAQ